MDKKIALRARNLTKIYKDGTEAVGYREIIGGGAEILKGIDIDIEVGDIVGFLGRNGAGKTTCMEMFVGFLKPTNGELEVLGYKFPKQIKKIRNKIGYVPQELSVFPHLTVRQNLELVAACYNDITDGVGKVNQMIAKFDLHYLVNKRVEEISGGQRRKLGIAIALLNDPEILFLDEPSTGLDAAAIKDVWEIVKQQSSERKITILFSTHTQIEIAEQLANKIVIIHNKQIPYYDRPENLKLKYGKEKIILSFIDESTCMKAKERLLVDIIPDGAVSTVKDNFAIKNFSKFIGEKIVNLDIGNIQSIKAEKNILQGEGVQIELLNDDALKEFELHFSEVFKDEYSYNVDTKKEKTFLQVYTQKPDECFEAINQVIGDRSIGNWIIGFLKPAMEVVITASDLDRKIPWLKGRLNDNYHISAGTQHLVVEGQGELDIAISIIKNIQDELDDSNVESIFIKKIKLNCGYIEINRNSVSDFAKFQNDFQHYSPIIISKEQSEFIRLNALNSKIARYIKRELVKTLGRNITSNFVMNGSKKVNGFRISINLKNSIEIVDRIKKVQQEVGINFIIKQNRLLLRIEADDLIEEYPYVYNKLLSIFGEDKIHSINLYRRKTELGGFTVKFQDIEKDKINKDFLDSIDKNWFSLKANLSSVAEDLEYINDLIELTLNSNNISNIKIYNNNEEDTASFVLSVKEKINVKEVQDAFPSFKHSTQEGKDLIIKVKNAFAIQPSINKKATKIFKNKELISIDTRQELLQEVFLSLTQEV